MRKLLTKLAILALPFLGIAAVTAAVDPYRYFSWSVPRTTPAWDEIASRMLPPLYKLIAFRRAPAPNILLGDSRMAELDPSLVGSAAGGEFANLAYGGASLEEAMKTFWLAEELTTLRSATFGINLDLYNESNSKDRIAGTQQILRSPSLYLSDRLVVSTAFYDIVQALTGHRPTLGIPDMSKEQFWRYQLEVTARIAYSHYRYPELYRRRLAEIAAHCREKAIQLRFVVFPEHRDLATEAERYGLADGTQRMIADLTAIGETIDLRGSVRANDKSQFVDPYHFVPELAPRLIETVWGVPPPLSGSSGGAQ